MKIIDKNDKVIESPNLTKGYLISDRLLIAHHEAVPAIEEKWHHEVTAVYPNGGKDVIRVVDIPAQPAKDAYDEYEEVMRYIEYTAEELAERAKPTQEERITTLETGHSSTNRQLLTVMKKLSDIAKLMGGKNNV